MHFNDNTKIVSSIASRVGDTQRYFVHVFGRGNMSCGKDKAFLLSLKTDENTNLNDQVFVIGLSKRKSMFVVRFTKY